MYSDGRDIHHVIVLPAYRAAVSLCRTSGRWFGHNCVHLLEVLEVYHNIRPYWQIHYYGIINMYIDTIVHSCKRKKLYALFM